MILGKLLLLPINLGRVVRPVQNNLESIMLQRERLFTSGKYSRQLPIYPVDVPASSDRAMLLKTTKKYKNKKNKSYISTSQTGPS